MLLKREFFIRGNIWRLEYRWNLQFRNKRIDGLCDPKTRTITIDRSLTDEEKSATFMHEFIHAVWEEYDCGHNSGLVPIEAEEMMLEALDIEIPKMFTIKQKRKKA